MQGTVVVRFKASETAACALMLDDRSIGASQVAPSVYEASVENARKILADAEAHGYGGGWSDELWREVRPCRAVAKRIKAALAKLGDNGSDG